MRWTSVETLFRIGRNSLHSQKPCRPQAHSVFRRWVLGGMARRSRSSRPVQFPHDGGCAAGLRRAEEHRNLLAGMGVLSETEVRSRYEVKLEKYNKLMNIEATTMERMARRTYLPVISAYATKIAKGITTVTSAMPAAEMSHGTTRAFHAS